MSQQLLSTPTLALRALEPTDLDTLYQWENDTALWRVTDTVAPLSRDLLQHYLRHYTADIYVQRQLRLIIDLTPPQQQPEPIGTIDLMHFDPLNNRAELGIYITPQHRHCGYGTQVLHLITAYARDHIGMRQLYAVIPVDNVACLRLFTGAGFRTVGTLADWVRRGKTYRDATLVQQRL